MIEYREIQTLGGGWSVEVRKSGALLGHIRKRPDTGAFAYYRGAANVLTASLESGDLADLKKQVEQKP